MKRLLLALLLIGASLPAYGQGSPLCYTTNGSNCVKVGVAGSSAFGPLPVTGSFSATTTGFTPATTGTPISVTTGGVTGTLPVGAVVVVSNAGSTNNAYCKLGASATTGDQLIAPSSWFAYTVGAATQLTCITSTSTTTVNMSGGSGLPTGAGGGGGSGGGGGAITAASGSYSSGALASGSIASGAIASGAVASGAFASGSLATGSMVDLLTFQGSKAAGTAATNSLLAGGVYNSSPLTLTTGQQASIQLDANGYAKVNVAAGGAGGGAITAASGSYSSGALASGSIASGAIVDLGAQADAAWSGVGSGSSIAIAKATYAQLVAGTITTGTQSSPSSAYLSTTGGLSQGSTTSGQTGSLIYGAVTTAAPTYISANSYPLNMDTHGGLRVGGAGYPAGATPIATSATGTISATTVTLPTGASVTTYLCGFSIRANATAAATANSTVTGTISTLNYTQWTAPAASGIGLTEQIFTPCIPASAANTGIAVISAAPGTGGVVSVTAWGFTL